MAEQNPSVASHPPPSGERLIVTVGVMMAVLLQVLDTTIANVALPHMQADLSATHDQINWVLTSYIVASAIASPISGGRPTASGAGATADLRGLLHHCLGALRNRDFAERDGRVPRVPGS